MIYTQCFFEIFGEVDWVYTMHYMYIIPFLQSPSHVWNVSNLTFEYKISMQNRELGAKKKGGFNLG